MKEINISSLYTEKSKRKIICDVRIYDLGNEISEEKEKDIIDKIYKTLNEVSE